MRQLFTTLSTLVAVLLAPLAAGSGLLVPTDENLPPLRITDHLVEVEIRDQVALTTLTQTFRNDTDRRLEATYVFPLPEDADLTDFQMSFNGKMVQGEVLPADKARQMYESIVRQAKDPGLIEFIGRRLLRMRVFPIEPKSDTTIKVDYQQVCRPISGMNGYHDPLRTNDTSGEAYGTVRFDVSIDTQQPLKNIWSPTHAVEIVRQGERHADIAYEAKGGSLEEDFILLYGTGGRDLGLDVIAYRPDDNEAGHFLLLLTPKQLWPEDEYTPQDVVFVIDTSGSMAGEKIGQARGALKYCIEQLDERDRFNVVRFSTGVDVFFDDLADADREHKDAARKFVGEFSARGGTNIAEALSQAAGLNPGESGRPFVVVFLTDGQGNRSADEIMSTVKSAAGDASLRIFPFGVGHEVNTKLLDRLANEYTGRPTYVQPGEDLELVLGDFFGTISHPVLTDLELDLPDIRVTERFPVSLGDLYHGQRLTIAGKFAEPATGRVMLTAKRQGKTVEYAWPDVAFRHTESAEYVPSIWAGRKIAYMIDQIRMHGETKEQIDEIVALSQEYGIQTPYSSWFVNPEGVRVAQNGQFGDVPSLDMAFQRTRRINPGGGGGRGGVGGFGGGGGAPSGARDRSDDEQLTFEEAREAVEAESGRDATIIARYQAALRKADTTEQAGARRNDLPVRKIAGRTYHRVGPFLVDAKVGKDHELVMVLFGSEAYFDLVSARPAWRKVFASSRNVVVPTDGRHAVVVVDEAGEDVIETFSEKMREEIGLDQNKDSEG